MNRKTIFKDVTLRLFKSALVLILIFITVFFNGQSNKKENDLSSKTSVSVLYSSISVINKENKGNLSKSNTIPGTLFISASSSLIITKNELLTVPNEITNMGNGTNFILESDANLIQINNTSGINIGSMTAKRAVTGVKNSPGTVDYVYWSSPVSGQQTKGVGGFSPGTPNNRFFYYTESNDRFYETSDLTFTPGKGYAVRAEDGYGSPYAKNYTFTGVPNNGAISYPITRSANDLDGTVHGFNMVGNPYPSNISFDELYAGNNPGGTSPLIYKTAWFWVNNFYQEYQQGAGYGLNNYAVYNGTGGNSAAIPLSGVFNAVIPNGIIKVGQGFLVQKVTLGTLNLNFNNAYASGNKLRVSDSGSFFLKETDQKNRFTLGLSTPAKTLNTQLIGYVAGATNNYEQDFDAEAFADYSDLFYSVLGDKKLLIQGRDAAFSIEDKVQLGAIFYQTGTYTISLQSAEGIFLNGQNIFLNDKVTNTIINLSEGAYTFQTTDGNTADRFDIIYKPESFLTTNNIAETSLQIYKSLNDFVVSSNMHKIVAVEVYDTSGRLIHKVISSQTKVIIPSEYLTKGILILKVNLQNGEIVTRKVRY